MPLRRPIALLTLALIACAPHPAAAPAPTTAPPAASATGAAITPADLRTRLYAYADDSMLGREAGALGDEKATAYIAAEFRRLGLRPAGDGGTYFQTVPLVARALDTTSAWIVAGADTIRFGPALVPLVTSTLSANDLPLVYGGDLTDSSSWLPAGTLAGTAVVLRVPASTGAYIPTAGIALHSRLAEAAVLIFAELQLDPTTLHLLATSRDVQLGGGTVTLQGPARLFITPDGAARLLGTPLDGSAGRVTTRRVSVQAIVTSTPAAHPARNVVAILPGSDPALRGEYVALGAHNDHVGLAEHPLDHDSVRAYNLALHALGALDPFDPSVSPSQRATIRVNVDSLHALHPRQLDSVYNGADDDGSGTVALLEIAEAFAHGTPPRRSLIFVSHTGEELGVFGSHWFTEHPTVPLDSIVTQLNMDMIGRGSAADVAGGGPRYLQLIGSRRLSAELGALVEAVNATEPQPFGIDYTFDAPGHPEQYYCRSDHAEYARFGIPVAFFSTGGHEDYHQLTDEPQYIDYDKLARVATLVHDIALKVGNLDHRPALSAPRPDPSAPCVQ